AKRVDLVSAVVIVTAAERHQAVTLRVKCTAAPRVGHADDTYRALEAVVRGGATAVPVVELRRLFLGGAQPRVRHLAPMSRRQLLDLLKRIACAVVGKCRRADQPSAKY